MDFCCWTCYGMTLCITWHLWIHHQCRGQAKCLGFFFFYMATFSLTICEQQCFTSGRLQAGAAQKYGTASRTTAILPLWSDDVTGVAQGRGGLAQCVNVVSAFYIMTDLCNTDATETHLVTLSLKKWTDCEKWLCCDGLELIEESTAYAS